MGYMGLNCWQESDNAADFFSSIGACKKNVRKAVAIFIEELDNDGNCYNTPGPVNIALAVEGGVLDDFSPIDIVKFIPVISNTLAKLEKMITENKNDTDENIVWHVTAYNRMASNLSKWIRESI